MPFFLREIGVSEDPIWGGQSILGNVKHGLTSRNIHGCDRGCQTVHGAEKRVHMEPIHRGRLYFHGH